MPADTHIKNPQAFQFMAAAIANLALAETAFDELHQTAHAEETAAVLDWATRIYKLVSK